ncbi:polysaccharide pyruvyl transferase CsaB [Anabaenopsis circularis NIES-21]|nr:polysaccharide pyruvyl transferase family protein [Nostoc cycadae]BAY15218.1 polysaccharide pyruvyl transferase CsaB [Anabaenopsis circularis NIES-21]
MQISSIKRKSKLIFNKIYNPQSKLSQLLFSSRYAKSFKKIDDYFSIQPIAGYVGWLGDANLGDEALYLAFKDLFSEFQVLTYDDFGELNYAYHRAIHPLELYLYRNFIKSQDFYNLVFLGGGTLIHWQSYLERFQHALQKGYQGIVFGTGVGDPDFWSDYYSDINYSALINQWVQVLSKAKYVSVRGFRSAKILENHGFSNAKVIGDPALSICTPRDSSLLKNRKIAINLGSHGQMWGSQSLVIKNIIEVVNHLLANNWLVEFIPMHQKDFDIGLDLIRNFNSKNISIWRKYKDIQQTLFRIKSYDIVIGQRLHSVVLAHGCGVPAIMLEYQPKCRDFMESMGMERYSLRTDTLIIDNVLELVEEIENNYEQHCEKLISKGNHYRLLQKMAAQEVVSMIVAGSTKG